MNYNVAIRDLLVARGKALFRANKQTNVFFTPRAEANALLNDLSNNPHAFVLACVMDRQIKAEKAWQIPHEISLRLGGFSMRKLAALSVSDIRKAMSKPAKLHRFPDKMADCFHSAVQRIARIYGGDASRIWRNKPSSAEVVYRFLEFDGVGPKIATMAANILARDFKIEFSDYVSIDLSIDVHVRRVFKRLGLCPPDATDDQLIYKARALSPDFPGIIDFTCWELGREFCRAKQPLCRDCFMNSACPKRMSNN